MQPHQDWIERVVAYLGPDVPPVAGRVLGWLMICRPEHQSAAQIASTIGASRASLTTSLRLLVMAGFLSKVTRPGDRTTYYQMDPEAWHRVVQRQIASIETFKNIARDGLEIAGNHTYGARLRGALQVFEWMEAAFANAAPMPSPERP